MAAAAPRAAGVAAPAARHRPVAGWFARNWKKVAIWTLVAIATLVLIFTVVPPVINWWNTSSFSVWSSDRAMASSRDQLNSNRKVANNNGRIKAIDSKAPELVDSANTAGERAEGKTLTRQLARERAATVRDQAAEMKNSAAVSRADAAETALSACDDGDDACIERALKLLRPPFMVKQEADELAAAKKAAEDAKVDAEKAKAAQKAAEEALEKEKAKPAKVVRIPGPTVYLPQPVATPPSAAPAIAPPRPTTTTPAAPSSGAVPCTFSRHGVAIETFTVSSEEECKRATFEKNEAFIFSQCVQKWGQDHCAKQRDIRKQAQGQNSW